jgi:hypothetical protein
MLVLYYASPASYGIRLRSSTSDDGGFSVKPLALPQDVAPAAGIISTAEHDELAGLRKAQAWGDPMFQARNAKYTGAMARLHELEAKERATAGHPALHPALVSLPP